MGEAGSKKRSLMSLVPQTAVSVPLVGRIAAGVPVEAIENVERSIDLSDLGIDNSDGGYFALRVKGESMVNAHILDGDLVIIQRQPVVGPKEIAAVLWNNEATLKYVKKTGGGVLLVPANDAMRPIAVDPAKTEVFEILGKVVRVIRSV
jgi:repressor LexA